MKKSNSPVPPTAHKLIVNLFKSKPGSKLSFKQIKKQLANKVNIETLYASVKDLEEEKILIKRGTHFKMEGGEKKATRNLVSQNSYQGKLQITMSGNGFLTQSVLPSDVRIHASNLASALDGDIVKVKLMPPRRGKIEGKVIEVVQRDSEIFTGSIFLSNKFAFVKPDKQNMPVDIFIPLNATLNAKEGDKVEVKIVKWHNTSKNPTGEVISILGEAGSADVEMKSILIENGFTLQFDDRTIQEAENFSEKISIEEIEKRRDIRNTITFTIDPFDAKDFDDAISYHKISNHEFEIGVHIADVAHYVKEKSWLDKEAAERTTSVYLVDRVLPMLPEKLSNQLCSLRPNEDKLCFSVIWNMNAEGKILNTWIGKTIIHSDKRFSYEEAQEFISSGKENWGKILQHLNELTKNIRVKRFKDGSIDFDSTEIKIVLDANGKPIDVIEKKRQDSNMLIEDLMLLANKSVAEFIHNEKKKNKKIEFVYRVHDLPDPDKLADFANLAALFGYKLVIDTPKQIAKSFNKLMSLVQGKPEQNMLQSLGIRTMAKAKYTTQNIGHYGLAFDHYSHFTSPIRRYPDVLAHRILFSVLNGKYQEIKNLEKICEHCSEKEKNAADAERQSIKYKLIEFVENEIGVEQLGLITGVTRWGIFVELTKSRAEGLVRAESFNDDWYSFDEKQHRFVGKNYGKIYQLGQQVQVKIIRINKALRTIDMLIVDEN